MEEIDPEVQLQHYVLHTEAEKCTGFYRNRENAHSLFAAPNKRGDL